MTTENAARRIAAVGLLTGVLALLAVPASAAAGTTERVMAAGAPRIVLRCFPYHTNSALYRHPHQAQPRQQLGAAHQPRARPVAGLDEGERGSLRAHTLTRLERMTSTSSLPRSPIST